MSRSRHVHLDPVSGLAGDMFAAAALDAGLVDEADLEAVLGKVGLGPVELTLERVRRGAISALHLSFSGWDPDEEKTHRHLTDIRTMLEEADLEASVRARALRMFERLGEAEAGVHGVDLEEVHFHEVGAVDSILDIVAAAWIVDQVAGSWSVGPISVGTGTTEVAHGTMPLPVPATAALLEGFELVPRSVPMELVTPTGAVILAMLRGDGLLRDQPPGRAAGVGYGAGTSDPDGWSNVTRMRVLTVAEPGREADADETPDRVVRLACEMDDLDPEVAAHVADRLQEAGALDVAREPVTMKKGRLGLRLAVLCRPADEDRLVDLLFEESSTFGVRRQEIERHVLDRERRSVETEYGTIDCKLGYRRGRLVQVAPEYASCRAASDRHEVPLRTVYRAALRAYEASSSASSST